jgi:hypothetical protein
MGRIDMVYRLPVGWCNSAAHAAFMAFHHEGTRSHEENSEYRAEHARKFNFGLAATCRDLKEQSRNLKTVRLPAKKRKRVRSY